MPDKEFKEKIERAKKKGAKIVEGFEKIPIVAAMIGRK